jgi:hypothetical protein
MSRLYVITATMCVLAFAGVAGAQLEEILAARALTEFGSRGPEHAARTCKRLGAQASKVGPAAFCPARVGTFATVYNDEPPNSAFLVTDPKKCPKFKEANRQTGLDLVTVVTEWQDKERGFPEGVTPFENGKQYCIVAKTPK